MLKDWIWLTTRKGLGARGVLQVLDYFGSPERAFYADPEQYDQIPGLSALARSSLREKGMELRQSPEATRGPSISPLMRPTRSSSPAALRE